MTNSGDTMGEKSSIIATASAAETIMVKPPSIHAHPVRTPIMQTRSAPAWDAPPGWMARKRWIKAGSGEFSSGMGTFTVCDGLL